MKVGAKLGVKLLSGELVKLLVGALLLVWSPWVLVPVTVPVWVWSLVAVGVLLLVIETGVLPLPEPEPVPRVTLPP